MLDQNTDRMWYVIGAVIVGAAIIFLMNSSFPQLFASVGDTFRDKTNDVMVDIKNIKPRDESNLITSIAISNIVRGAYYGSSDPADEWEDAPPAGELITVKTGYIHSAILDISVEAGSHYAFSAPNGFNNPRVVYFNANGSFISGKLIQGRNIMRVATIAPAGAVTMGFSANDSDNIHDDDEYSLDMIKASSPSGYWRLDKIN